MDAGLPLFLRYAWKSAAHRACHCTCQSCSTEAGTWRAGYFSAIAQATASAAAASASAVWASVSGTP